MKIRSEDNVGIEIVENDKIKQSAIHLQICRRIRPTLMTTVYQDFHEGYKIKR